MIQEFIPHMFPQENYFEQVAKLFKYLCLFVNDDVSEMIYYYDACIVFTIVFLLEEWRGKRIVTLHNWQDRKTVKSEFKENICYKNP